MHKKQIPRGPDDLVCPLHKQAMVDVCHKCPLWCQVRGKHPQSQNEIDLWDCSLAHLPMLLIENSQMQRQTAASVDKVATETSRNNSAVTATLIEMVNRSIAPQPPMILNGHVEPPKQLTEG